MVIPFTSIFIQYFCKIYLFSVGLLRYFSEVWWQLSWSQNLVTSCLVSWLKIDPRLHKLQKPVSRLILWGFLKKISLGHDLCQVCISKHLQEQKQQFLWVMYHINNINTIQKWIEHFFSHSVSIHLFLGFKNMLTYSVTL